MPYKDPTDPINIERARESRRKHYHKNKEAYIARAKAKSAELYQIVKEKKNVPCTDCGVKYPTHVMQFDHLDATTKVRDVSALCKYGNLKALLEEIDKCEVVCANCHADRTFKRNTREEQEG